MNKLCIYIAVYCVLLYTQSALQSWGGGGGGVSPQPPPVCSIHLAATGRSAHTSYRWRGERVIEPIKCMRTPHTSHRWRGERVIEPIKWMRSPHTSYRWRGERVIEPIKWMGIIRRAWLTRASEGNLARTPGSHPYSLREVPWDFNDHRKSGPRFNISSERRKMWIHLVTKHAVCCLKAWQICCGLEQFYWAKMTNIVFRM